MKINEKLTQDLRKQIGNLLDLNTNNKTNLVESINEITNDTGWISISSYLDTSKFKERVQYPLKIRKIGNIVYLTGEFYKIDNTSSQYAIKALNALPNEYRPATGFQFSGGGKQFELNSPYSIWIQDDGCIYINPTNFNATENYQGFSLSNVGSYPTD